MANTDVAGTLGGHTVYLRNDVAAPYVRGKQKVVPERKDIASDSNAIAADPFTRYLKVDGFDGGGGYEFFDVNNPTRMKTVQGILAEDGSVRPSAQEKTFSTDRIGPKGVTANNIAVFGIVDVYDWDGWSANTWSASASYATKGSGTDNVTSGAFFYDASSVAKAITGYDNGEVYWEATLWKDFGTANNLSAFVQQFDGELYVAHSTGLDVMDGDYPTATSTNKVTHEYNNITNQTGVDPLTADDVGLVWLVEEPDGRVTIHRYNVPDDTHSRLAKLPAGAFAGSVGFHFGAYYVPFLTNAKALTSTAWGVPMEMFLLVVQNNIQSIVGPFEVSEDVRVPLVGGIWGDTVMISAQDRIYGYDVETGAISEVATGLDAYSGNVHNFDCHQGLMFRDYSDAQQTVLNLHKASTSGTVATVRTGWYDFDYPGIEKAVRSVTLITDALATDGPTFGVRVFTDPSDTTGVLLSGHTTVGDAVKGWTSADMGSVVDGKQFSFQVEATAGSDEDIVTAIRGLVVSASPTKYFPYWELKIDTGTDRAGSRESETTINDLLTLEDQVTFVNPWDVPESSAPVSHTVTVLEIATDQEGRDGPQYAVVRLRGVDLV